MRQVLQSTDREGHGGLGASEHQRTGNRCSAEKIVITDIIIVVIIVITLFIIVIIIIVISP